MNLAFPSYSHIYLEHEARGLPLANEVVARFPHATLIEIKTYRELFNQSQINWREQKLSQKIIIASKHERRIFPATSVLPKHGGAPLYYTSPIINCIYDCSYCFLQAMYRSAHMIVFANEEDFYAEAAALIAEHGPITLSVSYDADLLATEPIIHWASRWIHAAQRIKGLTVELRTKSAPTRFLSSMPANPNVIIAWSLAPHDVWQHYEHRTSSPESRIESLKLAIDQGWRTRVCFDPVIPVPNWQKSYHQLIEQLFETVSAKKIEDLSVGVFRMGVDHLRTMKRRNPRYRYYMPNWNRSLTRLSWD